MNSIKILGKMICHRFEGETATKIFKFILPTVNNGSSFMDIPRSWVQPLVFKPDTYLLCQNECGPCGLFALIQAYMLATAKFNPDYSPVETLHESLLEMMLRLRQMYAFCTDFSIGTSNNMNSDHRYIDIQITSSKEEAKKFLNNTNYISIENVTFLLMISFAFLAGPKILSSYSQPETFITSTGMTDVHFVYLLLTGEAVDIPSNGCKNVGGILFAGVRDQQQIGFLSFADFQSERIGSNFTYPLYEVWIVHSGEHFTAIARKNNKFVEYDTYLKSNFKVLDSRYVIWDQISKIAKYLDASQ